MTIKTERARGLGRKTREKMGKGDQMTTLTFQTGVKKHQTFPGLPSQWFFVWELNIILSINREKLRLQERIRFTCLAFPKFAAIFVTLWSISEHHYRRGYHGRRNSGSPLVKTQLSYHRFSPLTLCCQQFCISDAVSSQDQSREKVKLTQTATFWELSFTCEYTKCW